MAYEIKWENNGVYWKYTGNVSGKEIVEASTAIYGDLRFDDLNYKLVDFTDTERFDVNENDIALLAFQHQSAATYKANIKNAIVIRSEFSELAFKFAALLNDSRWPVKVFDNLDDANNWVGRTSSS